MDLEDMLDAVSLEDSDLEGLGDFHNYLGLIKKTAGGKTRPSADDGGDVKSRIGWPKVKGIVTLMNSLK